MITNLHVKNLALIDEADVSFRPGLNILTGETGAGKSILLGSINLALGQKMTSDMIRSGADHALVELVFEIGNPEILQKLRDLGVDAEDGLLILSRKVQDGRSLCRLNGETCTAAKLREISSLLLDIHGQHEHQSLLYPDRQKAILDAYGKDRLEKPLARMEDAWHRWKEAQKELDAYALDERERQRELSLLEYEIKEIEEAAPCTGEDEELEKEYRRMANGRKILETLQQIHLLTGDHAAGDEVGRAVREISAVAELDEKLGPLAEGLNDIDGLLSDFNRELVSYLDSFTFSEEVFYQTEKRLDLLNNLKARYGRTLEDVLQYLEEQKRKQEKYVRFEEGRREAEEACRKAQLERDAAAEILTGLRKETAAALTEKIVEGLQELNFLAVDFEIRFDRSEQCHKDGWDEITFLISTNPGEPVRPLSRVVSGGELSRIMLAIKTILADKDSTETLLFDEIDTGVSGRTAQKVAEKMGQISRTHQVLCVTHLAQLAAMADHHFGIFKTVENGAAQTQIGELSREESVEEIARILGGAEVTETVRNNAREMKELACQHKAAAGTHK
ncbi:MAG: DNA repair protein RecN [Eubacterium sp.]|nr:DNA repair protein RecN [Eubacterium sp.]